MKLNTISDKDGARKNGTRVGRGIGSGSGKTAGRGHKGQKARSGVAVAAFEGGQMPIYRRLPKRGFVKPNRAEWNEVNLGRVQSAIDKGRLDAKKPVGIAELTAAGLVGKPRDGVRLLGKGELKAKVKFVVNHATKSAMAAVEKAGGSVSLVAPKAEAAQAAAAEGAEK
jgi:large subunit ribosomal protein L15